MTTTKKWPPLTPVIVTHVRGERSITTYGVLIEHDDTGVLIRFGEDPPVEIGFNVTPMGAVLSHSLGLIERDGVTEAFPSDALAAWESNPEHFGDLTNDLVADGSLWPV